MKNILISEDANIITVSIDNNEYYIYRSEIKKHILDEDRINLYYGDLTDVDRMNIVHMLGELL